MMNGDEDIRDRLGRLEAEVAGGQGRRRTPVYGMEYRSKARLFGLPLLHVAYGFDPESGKLRVARGIIAIGNIAIGLLAFGGFAIGGIAFGGLALGVISLAGVALAIFAALGGLAIGGWWAFGGMAIAGYVAVGGMAVSWNYAFGGMAIGKHPYGSNYQDPAALEFLRRLLPDWKW